MKPIPPYMTFEQALTNGYVGRIVNDAYRKYVRSLPCCACEAPADDPHHIYTAGLTKGMGTKVPDYWCIPLCRTCHDKLHHKVSEWEQTNGSQWQHVATTMLRAIHEGVLRA